MPRIRDRFDLWVRKARETTEPARQVDWVLGALIACDNVYFLNMGTKAAPEIARSEVASAACALIFTDADRVVEFVAEQGGAAAGTDDGPPVIASPGPAALRWCVENGLGVVLNPSVGESAMVPRAVLTDFLAEWTARGGRQAQGFWIPNMTSEEEDFWRENGL